MIECEETFSTTRNFDPSRLSDNSRDQRMSAAMQRST